MVWALLASTASVQVAVSSVVTALSAWILRGVFSDAAENARAQGRASGAGGFVWPAAIGA